MNSAPEPHSARPAATGRTTVRLVTLLVLCTLLGMSLDPCASAARGAEPRPAVSTVPEPLGRAITTPRWPPSPRRPGPDAAWARAAGPAAGRRPALRTEELSPVE